MTINSETQKKRVMLGGLMKLMFSVVILGVLWVSFSFVGSDETRNNSVKSRVVDLASFKEGAADTIEWEGRPVLVLRRSKAMLEILDMGSVEHLRDAPSQGSKQPHWAESAYRSRVPEWFVAIASGTDFGCPVEYLPASDEEFEGQSWQGGFKDTCRGSRYDLSGRVFRGQNAESNLEIPDYRIEKDTLHLGGL